MSLSPGTCRVLLPHPLDSRLLLVRVQGEWRLPAWHDETEHDRDAVAHVNRAVAARFGVETTVLRCVHERLDPGAAQLLRVYELDNHSPAHDMAHTMPGSAWIARADLDMLGVDDPPLRELLDDWFSREAGELPLRGAAWTRRGWFVEALAWAVARLRDTGNDVHGAPVQLRVSERGFLMRIHGGTRVFSFRAAPLMFAHEPALMHWLAAAFPDNFAAVVAADPERGWLLESEPGNGALPLDEVREEQEWCRAVRRLAGIQVQCAQRTAELRNIGCPDRGMETLARRIPRLCGDVDAMLPGRPDGLTESEIERVTVLAPSLLALCEELASYSIPDSLEHGDLLAANVLSTLDGPVYLGWSRSSLAHPFFTMAQLLSDAVRLLPASARESRRTLRDACLEPWHGFAPHDELVRAFEIARVLAPVHRAAAVHAEQLPAVGYRWEVESEVPAALRRALQLLTVWDER